MRILVNSYVKNCPKNLKKFFIFVWFGPHNYFIKKKKISAISNNGENYAVTLECKKCKKVVSRDGLSKKVIDKIPTNL